MSNYNSLKATINANIKTNGNQEITGSVLNSVLTAMVTSLGAGYQYMGTATPSTNPGTPDSRVFYLALTAGTYASFGGIVLAENEVALLTYDTTWSKESTGIATKAELGQFLDDVNNLKIAIDGFPQPTSDDLIVGYLNANGSWNSSTSYKSVVLDISKCHGMRLTMIRNNTFAYQWAFLKTYNAGGTSTFASGYSRVTGAIEDELIPDDANYVYFNCGSTSAAVSPTIYLNGERYGLDTRVENLEDAIGETLEYIPTYSVTTGSYVNNLGVVSANSSFHMTTPIPLKRGSVITFVGKANGNTAAISVTDSTGSSYTPKVIGTSNSTNNTYTYEADSDCYVCISYYTISSLVVNDYTTIDYIFRKLGVVDSRLGAIDDSGVTLPNHVISATSDVVTINTKIAGKLYARLTINHQVDTGDGQYKYKDLWRIASNGGLYLNKGDNTFTSLSKALLVSAENEFAIAFQGMGDFTGGYHGYERIDLDNSCYVVFILDGKEYDITSLVALGAVTAHTFAYRQKSFFYTGFNYSTPKLKYAIHVKRTEFKNGGFVTRNYLQLDLAALGISTLKAITAFTGLVCVNEDCALNVVGDDGTIYTATHPSTTATLVSNIAKTSRAVKMMNGDTCCHLDSRVIGTSVEAYKNPNLKVEIMDRADDCKYYAYLPYDIDWADGDVLETECEVAWDYRQ